jgi:hypothetical protein
MQIRIERLNKRRKQIWKKKEKEKEKEKKTIVRSGQNE